jgi:multidrug efflux pump subunit AcrA (membrane-fusion protein)
MTMSSIEEQLQTFVEQKQERERTARVRTALYSFIPVVLAAALLAFTTWQIGQASRQLSIVNTDLTRSQMDLEASQARLQQADADLTRSQKDLETSQARLQQAQTDAKLAEDKAATARKEADGLRQQLEDLNKSLNDLTQQMQLARDFDRYKGPSDWIYMLKGFGAKYPRQVALLDTLVGLRDTHWKLGGFSLNEGFDSPSFAVFVLQHPNVKGSLAHVPAESDRYRLSQVLPSTSSPQVGDLVLYKAGYTMFYFLDEESLPYVVGMTPLGILALRPNFAKVESYVTAYR